MHAPMLEVKNYGAMTASNGRTIMPSFLHIGQLASQVKCGKTDKRKDAVRVTIP
jgi:hypothetical protein